MKPCLDCQRPNKRGGKYCSACYRRRYYRTPNGKAAIYASIKRYETANPERRREWVHRWRFRVGLTSPDLQELRRAIKALDKALAQASRR